MRRVCILSSALIVLMAVSGPGAMGESLPRFHILTERWLPYQFEKEGQLQGISVDLLVLLLDRVGSPQGREDIKIYPWSRGYRYAQEKKNTILFLTTRTSKREKLFKWVGPVIKNHWLLIAKKSRSLRIESRLDLAHYTFGTVIDDVGEHHILNLGVTKEQLERNTAYVNCVNMLQADRVDMVVMSWETFDLVADDAGIDKVNFENVFTIGSSDLYYAFHRGTSDETITKFQNAFDELRAAGNVAALIRKYKNVGNE